MGVDIAEMWVPVQYQVVDDSEREQIYAGDDVHRAVLVSNTHHHPERTRSDFADYVWQTIRRFNEGCWGNFPMTTDQYQDLRNSAIDFELAWRQVPIETVAALGV